MFVKRRLITVIAVLVSGIVLLLTPGVAAAQELLFANDDSATTPEDTPVPINAAANDLVPPPSRASASTSA